MALLCKMVNACLCFTVLCQLETLTRFVEPRLAKLMLQEQQGRVLEMVDSLSMSTQAALSGLEMRLLALQARVDSCLPG